jgi:hypothetical protein
MLKWLKNAKSIVHTVYRNNHYLNCEQTSIEEINLRFQGYVLKMPK